MVGLKNGHIRKNLTQNGWTPEIYLGNTEEEEEEEEEETQFFLQKTSAGVPPPPPPPPPHQIMFKNNYSKHKATYCQEMQKLHLILICKQCTFRQYLSYCMMETNQENL